jgi:hypothetical protein
MLMIIILKRIGLIIFMFCFTVVLYASDPINPHGKPKNTEAGAVEHYALWKDKEGWHIRTMTKKFDHHFRGVISVAGGEFVEVKGFRLERRGPQRDIFIEGPEHHVINFDFSTKGSIDGVDFRVKGKEPILSFTMMIGEKEPIFEPERIFIGKNGTHPSTNPFKLPAHGM